jgi:hypothetical protein
VGNLPVHVLVGEGLELSYLLEHYWRPNADGRRLPGLEQGAGGVLRVGLSHEIRELALAVSHLQARYNALVPERVEAPVARAQVVLSELVQGLGFLFDDGVIDEKDRGYARMKKELKGQHSHHALGGSLLLFIQYAAKYRERLRTLPDFDEAIIDEGKALSVRISEQRGRRAGDALSREAQETRKSRARVARLLYDQMLEARSAFRYVFRNHTDVAERASSAHRRERRAAQRKRGSPLAASAAASAVAPSAATGKGTA